MNLFIHGKQLAFDLQKAIGIDKPIRRIMIDCDCQHAASVTVEFVPSPEEGATICGIMERYRLVRLGDENSLSRQHVRVEGGAMYVNNVKVTENCKP